MDIQAINAIQFLRCQAASLLLYQSILADEVGQNFLALLKSLSQQNVDAIDCLQAYGRWFQSLASKNLSWQEYIITQVLQADNPFTQKAQQVPLEDLPTALILAAKDDLQILQSLYKCSGEQLNHWLQNAIELSFKPVSWSQDLKTYKNDHFLIKTDDWSDALEELIAHYRQFGTGIFAQYRAFRWQSGQLIGINYPDQITLADLAGYETQKSALLKNTEFLLAGYPALNVLLYGSRGSGKSSLVKSLLNENNHLNYNLRLIEVNKSDLKDLIIIVEQLRNLPQKFIIFVDDLSFEEDDDAFKALKVVLEGSLTARPQNVVVYATSNRRHLIREFFDDRPRPKDAQEVHAWDTVQEKLSFSDRFGLTLTFEPADQKNFLTIVHHLATQAGIEINPQDLEYRALQWATRHNGRSGRTARQFVDFLKAELAIYG